MTVVGVVGARKWWALAGLSLGVLAVGLDATVLSVALPTLAVSLHASATDLQWFVSAYTLALAVALLPGGLLGDRFGRKKVMIGALSVFGLGSLACAYAPNAGAFIAARTVLGLAAGAMVPLVLSVVAVMFTDQERTRAVGVWAAANFLALPIGPILGGWLLSNYWWGWVFLMNLPVVVIGLVAVTALVPESRAASRHGLDPAGIVTSCGGLAILIYGFIAAGQYGWSSPTAISGMVSGVALLAAFAAWEVHLTRRPGGQPLVDLSLFRSARFTWGTILQSFGIFAMFGLLFAAPQFFQAILGVDAMGSGCGCCP
jgi:MFS transporter, DHA2 family, multidrug resistance protein